MLHCSSKTWIECVTKSITDQVEGQHGDHDGQTWEENQVGGIKHAVAFLPQHQTPFGGGWLGSQSQEAQSGGIKDCGGNAQRSLDDQVASASSA